jgi:PPOX class probable F420-dependent enzyme
VTVETPPSIPDAARRFLERPGLFATLATISPDGTAHQAVIWYELRGDAIIINSREGRRWPTNLRRDRRASIAVEDGYDWVGVRGEVEVIDDQAVAQADIASLAHRYYPDDPAAAEADIAMFRQQKRVSFLLRPEAVYVHLGEE